MNPDLAFEVLLSGQPIPDRPMGQGPAGGGQADPVMDDEPYGDEEGSGDMGLG